MILILASFSCLSQSSDTLNVVDSEGRRQGHWRFYENVDYIKIIVEWNGRRNAYYRSERSKNTYDTIERKLGIEGSYKNNLKQGAWTSYSYSYIERIGIDSSKWNSDSLVYARYMYDKSPEIKSIITFKDDTINGRFESYYSFKRIEFEGELIPKEENVKLIWHQPSGKFFQERLINVNNLIEEKTRLYLVR